MAGVKAFLMSKLQSDDLVCASNNKHLKTKHGKTGAPSFSFLPLLLLLQGSIDAKTVPKFCKLSQKLLLFASDRKLKLKNRFGRKENEMKKHALTRFPAARRSCRGS